MGLTSKLVRVVPRQGRSGSFQGLKTYYRAKENCAYGMCKTKWAMLKIVRTALSSDFSFFCYQLFFTSLSTTSLSPSISCPRFVSFSFLWHAFLLAIFAPGVPFSPSLALNISCPRHLFLLTSLAMSSRQALIISFS